MRILLICYSGMSSSVLVQNMIDAAKEMNLDVTVDALGSSETNQRSIDYDVILLAPQVRYQKANFVKASGGKVPVEPIDMVAYGTLDGKKALKAALKAVEEFKKQ
ncbi:MAG: PTS sugar transporter subunit IIB [Erysipelotrichaceae bacterium]|nr:PTS sugar transporter subunit IIB [Erysipelotrichaceae bacterium]